MQNEEEVVNWRQQYAKIDIINCKMNIEINRINKTGTH